MATISNNNNLLSPASGNAQLAGIVNTVPMPRTPTPVLADGTPVYYDPFGGSLALGGSQPNQAFSIHAPVTPGSQADLEQRAASAAGAPGAATIGGGAAATPPAPGAQPAAPGSSNGIGTAPHAAVSPLGGAAATVGAAALASEPSGAVAGGGDIAPVSAAAGTHRIQAPAAGVAARASADAPVAEAVSVSGFGSNDRGSAMQARIGEAQFSFPSFNSTKKQTAAPAITWGAGWKRVDKGDGFFYMEHTNGTKAVPAVEWRMTPTPLDGAKQIKVANGWGKKFPDGTVLVFDKKSGPYVLDAKGAKRKIGPGTHTFGGVKVRIFEASVVRVLEKNGAVSVFDSRGNHGAGTPRKVLTGAAAMGGGGVQQVGQVAGGGPKSQAELVAHVQQITSVARGLLQQVQAGTLDPAALAAFQAQLSTLPDGIRQAIGGMGVTTGDAAALGLSGAAGGGAPVAGHRAEPSTRSIAAGTKLKIDGASAAGDASGVMRFGQLPDSLQEQIATALGSSEGAGALEADARVRVVSGGVEIVDATTAYLRKQVQVAGGGPGDDLAMTLKPVRQPGAVHGGGAARIPSIDVSTAARAPGTTVHGGGGASNGTQLFRAGEIVTVPALANATHGSYTWASLPTEARRALEAWLSSSVSTPAGAAWAARGDGEWTIDPAATVVIGSGTATFPAGLTMSKPHGETSGAGAGTSGQGGAAPTPPPAPGVNASATTQPIGHDARTSPLQPVLGRVAPGVRAPS